MIRSVGNSLDVHLSLGTVVLDRDDVVIHVDQAFTAVTGYGVEDASTLAAWLEQAVPDKAEREHLLGEWRSMRADGGVHQVRFTILRPTGEPVAMKGSVNMCGGGVAVLSLGTISPQLTELTSLLMAKESIDGAAVLVMWVKTDGSFFYVNKTALRELGQDWESMRRLRVWDLDCNLTPKKWPEVVDWIRNKEWNRGRISMRRKDGSVLPVDMRCRVHICQGMELIVTYAVDMTAALAMEEALRVSEERYRLVVKAANDGIWDWNLGSDSVYYSDRYLEIIGFEQEDMGNTYPDWSARIHPDDQERVLEASLACLRGEIEQYELEYRMRHKDGSWRWILGKGAGLKDENGKVQRLAGTHTDITMRKKAVEELRISEQYYRSLFENTGLATFICQEDDMIRECNSQFEQLSGLPAKEIEGRMRWTDFVDEEDLDRMQDYTSQRLARKGNPPTEYEFVFLDSRGRRRDCHVKVASIPGTTNHISSLQDITERRGVERTTKALFSISTAVSTTRDMDELYRALHGILNDYLDATNFFIAMVDEERDLLTFPYYSDEKDDFWDLPGVSDPEVKSLTLHVIRSGKILFAKEDDIRELVEKGALGIIGAYPAVWLGVPLILEDKIIGAMAVQHYENPDHYKERDVRLMAAVSEQVALALERKANEKALLGMNEDLEAKVAERTGELAEKAMELEAVNVRLMELDKIKSQLLSSVSHELRTPLTSIRGFVKLCSRDFRRYFYPSGPEEAIDAVCRKQAKRIEDNLSIVFEESKRLTRLINDFLDLSRIESGRMDWNDISLEPGLAIRSALAMIRGEFADKTDITLRAMLPDDLPLVHMDPDRLQQVLVNLLGNAAKFTSKGAIDICARSRNGVLQVEVRDSGIGIEPQELTRLFDSFYTRSRGDTLSQRREGTGLGLAICKEILHHYGGLIWGESVLDKGSSFFFEVPTMENEDS